VGWAQQVFREGDERIAWWAELNPRFASYSDAFVLRWTAPDGHVVQQEEVDQFSGPYIGSVVKFENGAEPGVWTAELLLGEDMVDRRSVDVRPR
jgi:hypothetical protein